MNLFYLLGIVAIGILNAGYLYWQYRAHETRGRKMVCLLGGDCEEVVTSKYGKTFGIKNEVIGLSYYSLEVLLLLLLMVWPKASVIQYSIIAVASLAAAYSTYLTYAQSFILKKYCSWCLFSTAINWIILILATYYFLSR